MARIRQRAVPAREAGPAPASAAAHSAATGFYTFRIRCASTLSLSAGSREWASAVSLAQNYHVQRVRTYIEHCETWLLPDHVP